MSTWKHRLVLSATAIVAVLLSSGLGWAPSLAAATPPPPAPPGQRYVVVAKSDADYDALRAEALQNGGAIIQEDRAVQMLVVGSAAGDFKARLSASAHAASVATDHVEHLIQPALESEFFNASAAPQRSRIDAGGGQGKPQVTPDPAFSLPGLMWNFPRIQAPQAWKVTTGSPAVKVGVADTGLDFTHPELAGQIADVVDFTANENPPLCKTFFGASDADFAAQFGGPATTDWNGHGSWIGGNIAALLNGVGVNGIAPSVKLVALKISGWCGSAYDSTIIDAFVYAADHGIDIVSISFGGYLNPAVPDELAIYKQYVQAVRYARLKGTVIVAAAGNEHVRVGAGGLVLSHGSLNIPGDPLADLFGLLETPGGVPGVVMVSATGNTVEAASGSCASNTTGGDATCKPASDAHQPTGVGRLNQLTYYSNYGPRIDVAAPGGARKFNLPRADRGGTAGWPVTTADSTKAWEDFGITSDWALEIPCYVNLGPGFYPNDCYTIIQGTSMATPHASAVLALMASQNPGLRGHPEALVNLLKDGAQHLRGNTTPPLSATDLSAGDLTGIACTTGYCHLGGAPVSDQDAYGAGLVSAFNAVSLGH